MFGSQYLRHYLGIKSNPGTNEKPKGAGLVTSFICVCTDCWFTLSKNEYFALPEAVLDPRDRLESGAAVS